MAKCAVMSGLGYPPTRNCKKNKDARFSLGIYNDQTVSFAVYRKVIKIDYAVSEIAL